MIFFSCWLFLATTGNAQTILSQKQVACSFDLAKAVIYIDVNDEALVQKAASLLQQDIERVTGKILPVINKSANLSYNELLAKAEEINTELAPEYRDAFFQLVPHSVKAFANLQELYTTVAKNHFEYTLKLAGANTDADKVKRLYDKDSLISLQYHQLGNGKWNHMMDQTHIGYTYWQQPPFNKMPEVKYVPKDSIVDTVDLIDTTVVSAQSLYPKNLTGNIFREYSGYIAIDAEHFTKAINSNKISWNILPDLGRTGSAVTTFPVTAADQKPSLGLPQLQYEIYTYSKGEFKLSAYLSQPLNFFNTATGLQYPIAVDGEQPQIISINKNVRNQKTWENRVANNIIIKTTTHNILTPGKHTVKYWVINPGVIAK